VWVVAGMAAIISMNGSKPAKGLGF
jgi:hypothetical protein